MKLDSKKVSATRPIAEFLLSLPHEQFVLHGSLNFFKVAEPKQAQGDSRHAHQNLFAVYASIAVEFALIHALIRGPSYGIDHENGLIIVRGDSILIERGYIYVLPSSDFAPIEDGVGGIWRTAPRAVETLAVIEVGAEMLPHFPLIAFECDELQEKA